MQGETPQPTPRRGTSPQFGMRGLLIFTTGLCVLFAILAALRVAYWQMLIGFFATSAFSLVVIVMLETYKNYDARRRGQAKQFPPPQRFAGGYRYPRRPRGTPVDVANADPTGIEFVDPADILFVADDAPHGTSAPAEAAAELEDGLILAMLADDKPSGDCGPYNGEPPTLADSSSAPSAEGNGSESGADAASHPNPQISQSADPPSLS